jgi:uncharacterized protein (DUF1778 family)
MDKETRSTDAKGRISLSKAEIRFYEELATPLCDRDRDLFLDLLNHPPVANPALTAAAERYGRTILLSHADGWPSKSS